MNGVRAGAGWAHTVAAARASAVGRVGCDVISVLQPIVTVILLAACAHAAHEWKHIGLPPQVPGPGFFSCIIKKYVPLSTLLGPFARLCQANRAERPTSWWSGLKITPLDPARKRGGVTIQHHHAAKQSSKRGGQFGAAAFESVEADAESASDPTLCARCMFAL